MSDAYFVHDDNYAAMKADRDKHNAQKKIIHFDCQSEESLEKQHTRIAKLVMGCEQENNKLNQEEELL